MTKTSRVIFWLRWIFGVLFALIGITNFSSPFFAIVNLAIAAMLIPPVMIYIQKRAGRIFARKYKVVALVVLLVLFTIASPPSTKTNPNEVIDKTEQAAKDNLEKQADQNQSLEQPKAPETKTAQQNINTQTSAPPAIVPAPQNTPVPKPKTETPKPQAQPKPNCDPNYSGCVPIASDVDCLGGSGDGPAYTGQVNVIGKDIYGLDRDHDGVACE